MSRRLLRQRSCFGGLVRGDFWRCGRSGTLVAEGSTHARTEGRRGRKESSGQAVYNGVSSSTYQQNDRAADHGTGRTRVAQVATTMTILSRHHRHSALRFYRLALVPWFTKGRKSRLIVVVCLCAARRLFPARIHARRLLLLQINVFVLSATYLKLIKVLHLPRPYAIDPVHYIALFAALLELGDETSKLLMMLFASSSVSVPIGGTPAVGLLAYVALGSSSPHA